MATTRINTTLITEKRREYKRKSVEKKKKAEEDANLNLLKTISINKKLHREFEMMKIHLELLNMAKSNFDQSKEEINEINKKMTRLNELKQCDENVSFKMGEYLNDMSHKALSQVPEEVFASKKEQSSCAASENLPAQANKSDIHEPPNANISSLVFSNSKDFASPKTSIQVETITKDTSLDAVLDLNKIGSFNSNLPMTINYSDTKYASNMDLFKK